MRDINTVINSSELTSIVIDHLNIGVFVIDKSYHLRSLNNHFTSNVGMPIEMAGDRICDQVVGCVNAEVEVVCFNKTPYCVECELMAAIRNAIENDITTAEKMLVRQREDVQNPISKYYRYSCKPLSIENEKFALLMIDDITDLEKQRAELFEQNMVIHKLNEKFKQDLALARAVQKSIIPKKPVKFENYNIDFLYFPLEAIGGDMFDIFELDEDKVGIFMCDVVGHGSAAALITTMVKALLATYSEILVSPKKLMDKLNRQLMDMTDDFFMTAFYGVLDMKQHKFTFVRAGHPFPWMLNDAIQTFGHHINPIIGINRSLSYNEEFVKLAPGDKIVLYTDGLLDVGTDDGNYESRLIELFDSNAHTTGKKLLSLIKNDIISKVSSEKHMDDVCILIIENTVGEER